MDYRALAGKMLDIRAQLSHLPVGCAVTEACGGEYFALSFLLTHGYHSCPSELSRSMGVSSARIAALLKHLEQKGWVSRCADSSDERRVKVVLTDAGRGMISQRREDAMMSVAKALERLGEDDAREYVRLQQKMLSVMLSPDNAIEEW